MSERAEKLRIALADKILDLVEPGPGRIMIEAGSAHLVEAAQYLLENLKARFVTASAMEREKEFELIYHFALDPERLIVSVRIRLPLERPAAVSLCHLTKAAEFIEREIHELFGIQFPGHPHLDPLLLPEDWPSGDYPLRREK
jgi:NADH-quinone oxidoreductase subunit C